MVFSLTLSKTTTVSYREKPRIASRPVTAAASNQQDVRSAAERAAEAKRAVPEGADGTGADVPASTPIAAAPHRSPVDVLLSGPTFVRFVGFSMLSMGIGFGVLFVFWRQTRDER